MKRPPSAEEELQDEVVAIAENVWDARFDLSGGQVGWIGYLSSGGKPVPLGRNDFYGGQLGIGVFFAAMYAVFHDDSYRRYAHEASRTLIEGDETDLVDRSTLGIGTGIGSYIYGLTAISRLVDDPMYQNRAGELVQSLSQEMIDNDNRYDVLCGVAGTVIALLSFWEQTGNRVALEKATRCGEHLLENRRVKWNNYMVWDTSRKGQPRRIRTGMGHGAGGIGYALFRLYGHTNRADFREAAENAISFENLFYSGYENNWKANPTYIKHYPLWWCNGLIGIGNARLGSLEYHESDQLRRDLDRAKRGLDSKLLSDDSICHGTCSQIDFLIELSQGGANQYAERANQLATWMVERRRDEGTYRIAFGDVQGIYNPIFFGGTAGIGYTLLRLMEPETIPCPLRFE